MPGFLGGSSSGGGGTGGTINFPTEFIDPVTKLRISQPENLIDTDFEYGLQPTKWETVELINNIPSFFSKSGDTTIPNIIAITTIVGSREITVRTSLDHGLSVGIPINVSGTKSITADGAYIINSIPNARTFTYLGRENQFQTAGIEDLYTSIITGEFFQGSQIKISEAAGIVTDAETPSVLTVKTDSPHGFGPNTPLYFLNLNSSITQEFDSTNTEAKSFDSSNNVTARTFDGSNTVQSINIDFSNRAASSPVSVASSVSGVNTVDNEITVTHSSENFNGRQIGTALQYNVNAASGYFADNPRGVVFLKTAAGLGINSSTFRVSAVPDGSVIEITSNISGTFQIADLAATFAGNNAATEDQINITLTNGTDYEFDGDNSVTATYTVSSIGGLGSITFTANTNWTIGQMVRYSTTGAAATGLTNNTTYWVTALNASTNLINISDEPGGDTLTAISGGTGTQTFTSISVSLDRDIIAIPGHDFQEADMVLYSYPEEGRITTASDSSDYYFVKKVYDSTYISLTSVKGFVRDGTTEARAATSAAEILAVAPESPSGSYWIKPAGSETAYLTYCEMTTSGGGWTQIMKLSSNTLLTNNTSSNVAAPIAGAAHTFAPNWDGWAWNQDSQFTTLFPLANNATFADVDSFSPLFYKMPFNDIMIMQISDPVNAVAWRHDVQIANMRAVTGGTNNSTYGNTWLYPPQFASNSDEWSMVRRLGTHPGTTQLLLQPNGRFGFKVLADTGNNFGNVGTFLTGGFTTLTSGNVTGHGVSMIGMGGVSTTSGRWGGGIGFTYVTGPRAWRGSGHWWQQGDSSGATNNRAFLNLAVFVRPL